MYIVGQHDSSITNSYMDNTSISLSKTQQGPDIYNVNCVQIVAPGSCYSTAQPSHKQPIEINRATNPYQVTITNDLQNLLHVYPTHFTKCHYMLLNQDHQ